MKDCLKTAAAVVFLCVGTSLPAGEPGAAGNFIAALERLTLPLLAVLPLLCGLAAFAAVYWYFHGSKYMRAVRYCQHVKAALERLPLRIAAVTEDGEYLFSLNQHIFHTIDQSTKFEPEMLPPQRKITEQVLTSGMHKVISYNIDEEYFRSDVTFMPRSVYGRKVAFWLTSNLTDLYVMQQEILNQASWVRNSLNALYDSIVTTDEHGVVTLLNDHAEWLLGVDKGEAVGKRLTTLLGDAFPSQAKDMDSAIVAALNGYPQIDLTLAPAERNVYISLSLSPLQHDALRGSGLVLIGHDLTKEHSLQRELQTENSKLKAAEHELGSAVAQLREYVRHGKVVSGALRQILQSNDLDDAIPRLLQLIGGTLGVDRISICKYEENGMLRLFCEWLAKDSPAKPRSGAVFPAPMMLRGDCFLRQDRIATLSPFDSLPEERRFMEEHHIRAGMAAGIWLREKLWGFIAIDYMKNDHELTELDKDMLLNIASLISSAAERRKYLKLREPGASAEVYLPPESRL